MTVKRKHDQLNQTEETQAAGKKPRKGFSVGPANLPDGTYRRKTQKIKDNLIHKAKVKKSYAKLKEREQADDTPTFDPYADPKDASSPTLEIHPERQAMLDNADVQESKEQQEAFRRQGRVPRRSKPHPFEWEARLAEQKREEARARQLVFDVSNKERREKAEERERLRRAMAKARKPGQNGQRRLGRESKVLLERVKKIIAS